MDLLRGIRRRLVRRSLGFAAIVGVALTVLMLQAPTASASGVCVHSLYSQIPTSGDEGSATFSFPSTSNVVGYGFNEDGSIGPNYTYGVFYSPSTELVIAQEPSYDPANGWFYITYTC